MPYGSGSGRGNEHKYTPIHPTRVVDPQTLTEGSRAPCSRHRSPIVVPSHRWRPSRTSLPASAATAAAPVTPASASGTGVSPGTAGLTQTRTNRRVRRLKTLPNMSAISVQLMMITLYGMLKSGVARSTSNAGVYIRVVRPRPVQVAFCPGDTSGPKEKGTRTAGGRSQPRCASGWCSV